MKKLLILTIVISLLGCGGALHLNTISGGDDCLTQLGRYDTSVVIAPGFMKGKQTIVYMQDDSCVMIWGKTCEFRKNEMLYVKAEWWATPPGTWSNHWKYFLINKDKSLRYSLLPNK